jgi:hypothetical protein
MRTMDLLPCATLAATALGACGERKPPAEAPGSGFNLTVRLLEPTDKVPSILGGFRKPPAIKRAQ